MDIYYWKIFIDIGWVCFVKREGLYVVLIDYMLE